MRHTRHQPAGGRATGPRTTSRLWRDTATAVLALAGVLGPGQGTAQNPPKDKPTMSQAPAGSFPPAPEIEPVVVAGVRYAQDRESLLHGGDQATGYLVALDVGSGQRLWMLKVYTVATSAPGAPTGMPGIYFARLQAIEGGRALEVLNEAGGLYHVELATRQVRQVGGPPEAAASASALSPPKPKPKP